MMVQNLFVMMVQNLFVRACVACNVPLLYTDLGYRGASTESCCGLRVIASWLRRHGYGVHPTKAAADHGINPQVWLAWREGPRDSAAERLADKLSSFVGLIWRLQ